MTAPSKTEPTDIAGLPAALASVAMTLSVRIGTARRTVRELTQLAEGTEITLGARVDDPVEICVEDRVVARGELAEAEDGGLAVKITEVVAG